MGASFLDAWRPFTVRLMPPTWYVLLPSEQIIGFNFLGDGQYVSQSINLTKTQPPPHRETHAQSNQQHESRMLNPINSMKVAENIYISVLILFYAFSPVFPLSGIH
jgi:hypothetical protein